MAHVGDESAFASTLRGHPPYEDGQRQEENVLSGPRVRIFELTTRQILRNGRKPRTETIVRLGQPPVRCARACARPPARARNTVCGIV